MNFEACETDAYGLLHRGAIALARVETAGIRVDLPYLASARQKLACTIAEVSRELEESDIGAAWKKQFGANASLGSRDQLAWVVEHCMDVELPKTASGAASTARDSLLVVDHPFVELYARLHRLQKADSTYLSGIQRQVSADGFLRPFFNLHIARSYRSSSNDPNFQNFPHRDPEITPLVRRCLIPRKGRRLIEIDYKSIEVRIAACYHHDPTFIEYVCDPTKDMHRDMACECFRLPMSEVTGELRFLAKSFFVFAEFYGNWYKAVAEDLWKAVAETKQKTVSGRSVVAHLRGVGLGTLEKFTEHIKSVEHGFWYERFPVYTQWKDEWFDAYTRRGWLKLLSGFKCRGRLNRRQVINYPIQGTAFHCLLWALTKIVLHDLPSARLTTLIPGQIHDSIMADVPADEEEVFMELVVQTMTQDIRKVWPWLIVPLEIEAETYSKSWAEADKE